MSALLLRAWVRPLVIGLSLSLGICGGNWAAIRLLWTAIEWMVETLAALTVDIEQARDADRDRGDDLGLELPEIDGARFVMLPAGTPDRPFWTVSGRPASKLSSE